MLTFVIHPSASQFTAHIVYYHAVGKMSVCGNAIILNSSAKNAARLKFGYVNASRI
jgi:hypothetical protein